MCRRSLKKANRELIAAIETPPDSGVESRLDSLAASIWQLQDRRPDPGRLARLRRKLAALADDLPPRRARHVRRARRHLAEYAESIDEERTAVA